MQIVIKIDEKDKQDIDWRMKGRGLTFFEDAQLIKRVVLAVFHGTPLPKGHDRLVEARAVVKALFDHKTIDDVLTIIEADEVEE